MIVDEDLYSTSSDEDSDVPQYDYFEWKMINFRCFRKLCGVVGCKPMYFLDSGQLLSIGLNQLRQCLVSEIF